MPRCWPPASISTSAENGESDMATAATPAEVTIPSNTGELRKLLEQAQAGDASTLPVLRKMLEDPAKVDIFGNLAKHAERSLISAAAGDDLAFKEALTRKLELLRTELEGPNPTPVERLLVERIVACWLQVQDADARYAQSQNCTLAQGEYYQRRMDHAHRRYLSALKTLAVVRKLAIPVLQVNIAKRQVNVAGACPVVENKGDDA
jgi:hypothetical protein